MVGRQSTPVERSLRLMVAVPPTGPIAARGDEASFEWQRVRFVNQGGATFQPELIPLGKTLINQDPVDYSIRRTLVQLLADKMTDVDAKASIALCDEALRRPACRASWLAMKSYAYQIRWDRLGHKRADVEAAIEATQQSIQALPPNSRVRPELELMLAALKKNLAKSK